MKRKGDKTACNGYVIGYADDAFNTLFLKGF